MTGTEILTLAQYLYQMGSSDTATVVTAMWVEYLNEAIRTAYDQLPSGEMSDSSLMTVDEATALTSGQATLDADVDRLLVVRESGIVLAQVGVESVQMLTLLTTYAQPSLGSVWALDLPSRELYVRPATVSSVDVTYLVEPTPIAVGSVGSEVTSIPERFQGALAQLMAGLAYLSEEDTEAAAPFLELGTRMLTGTQEVQA